VQVVRAVRRVAAAVADGRLAVRYQRIVDRRSGRVIGAEALVRLDDAEGGGLLLPDMFIDVAEDSGLVADIDAWVLDTALAQVASWRQTFGPARHATVSVNVSSRTLAQGGYAELAAGLLGTRPLPRGTLHVELTERTLLDSSGLLSEELRLLRHNGALIGLDDFGTGFSGLHYLQRFDLDFVKIDRSYVVGLDSDPRSRTLMGSMIGMAHSLDLPVIAEGVETEAQLTALAELGCDYAQGHLLGQPEPPETLTAWLGHVAV
jgi:EAL domain-containing protein (putative c-di-GMP-specific phosphodiesterase class I)